jgi:hypothetical protein
MSNYYGKTLEVLKSSANKSRRIICFNGCENTPYISWISNNKGKYYGCAIAPKDFHLIEYMEALEGGRHLVKTSDSDVLVEHYTDFKRYEKCTFDGCNVQFYSGSAQVCRHHASAVPIVPDEFRPIKIKLPAFQREPLGQFSIDPNSQVPTVISKLKIQDSVANSILTDEDIKLMTIDDYVPEDILIDQASAAPRSVLEESIVKVEICITRLLKLHELKTKFFTSHSNILRYPIKSLQVVREHWISKKL